MLNPEEIHQQAEAERRKAVIRHKKWFSKPKEKRFFPKPAESRFVFHKIYPHSPNFLITFMLPAILFITALLLWYMDKRRFHQLMPWSLFLPLIPVLTWLIYFFRERVDYLHYKTWRNDLGFPVHGWDQLGQSPKFPSWKFWDRNTIVQVHVKPGTDAGTYRLLNDLLYLFTVSANKTFYAADQVQPGAAGDLRHKWGPCGELEVSGSANSSVMGTIYQLVDKKLRALQVQRNCIESVSVKYSKEMLEIQSLQVSD